MDNEKNVLSYLKEIKLNTDLYFGRDDRCKKVGDIFYTNIFEILDGYGSIFNIDIESSINKDKTAVLRVFAKMFFFSINLKHYRGR